MPLENIVRNGEHASSRHCLLISQCFVSPTPPPKKKKKKKKIVAYICFGKGLNLKNYFQTEKVCTGKLQI